MSVISPLQDCVLILVSNTTEPSVTHQLLATRQHISKEHSLPIART